LEGPAGGEGGDIKTADLAGAIEHINMAVGDHGRGVKAIAHGQRGLQTEGFVGQLVGGGVAGVAGVELKLRPVLCQREGGTEGEKKKRVGLHG
jgi:hypothetical protein